MRTIAIAFAVLLALTLASAPAAAPLEADDKAPAASGPPEPMEMEALEELNEQLEPFIVEGEPEFDPVPSLDAPRFISVTDAGLSLDSRDIVFVIQGPQGAEIYPRLIMARHEVLNLPGKPRRTLTYCPLTGSTQGYYGHVGMFDTTLGTTGSLVNSNRILYDRSTNSRWPQMLGLAISGPLAGRYLKTFPVLWTTWSAARNRWPEARVLSEDTGFRMRYDKDPYGSYSRPGTYYDSGGSYYPLSHVDTSMAAKARILGLSDGFAHLAVPRDAVKGRMAADIDFGTRALVALYDPDMDAVRIFDRLVGSESLTFDAFDGRVFDRQTKSYWNPEGVAVEGRLRGMRLTPVAAMDCFWFAWVAFHPHTRIYK